MPTLTPQTTGPWALLTGGSSGIGKAHAHLLAQRGFNLILVGRNEQRLADAAEELRGAAPVEVHTISQDLARADAAEQVLAGVGSRVVGVFVATAGEGKPGSFVEGDVDSFLDCIGVKVTTNLRLTHSLARSMKNRGRGAILLVASTGGLQGVPLLANNAAAEAFVLSLGEALHHELKPHGVTATVLMPGPTATPGMERMIPDPKDFPPGTMTAAATAAEGIKALDGGKVRHIAGLATRAMMTSLPRSGRTALMNRMLANMVSEPAIART